MAENLKTLIVILNENSNKIGKLLTNTKKCGRAKITRGYLETRSEMLNEYWSIYIKQYEQIISTYSKTELKTINFDPENSYDTTEEACLDLKTFIKDWLYELQPQPASLDKNDTCSSQLPRVRPKLPPITIPTFSGDYNEWISFRDLYISLIHNESSLTKIEKHHYLKSSLTGEAEQLLKNFTLTEANYDDAWKKLEERYDNKRIIVNNILNRLLSQKKLVSESAKGIKELLDTTSQCLDSLKNIKIDTTNWDPIIVHIVVGKLDTESHKQWEQSLGKSTDISSYVELASFLENRFRTMEMVYSTQVKEPQRKPITQKSSIIKTYATEVSSTCTYCSQNHYVCHCKDFANLDVIERQEFVKKNNICFNCLVKGHGVVNCRQSTSCRKCGRRHHTLLHNSNPFKSDISNDTEDDNKEESPTAAAASCNNANIKNETQNSQVILATAQIAVSSKNGNTYILRALIDQGSQASFVTEKAAQLLQMDRIPVHGKITGVSDSTVVTTRSMVKFTIHTPKKLTPLIDVHAYVLKKLTSLLPSREFPQNTWPQLQLDLADPEFHMPGSVDVLLGADVHAKIIKDGLHKHDSLVASNSHLGWLISGKVSQTETQNHNVIVTHTKIEVDQLLRQFWEIEECLPQSKPLSKLDIQCEEHFKNTYSRNDNGRYVVRLPFKEDPSTCLGDSKSLALCRLQQMEKRFARMPNLKEQYNNFMKEYLSQGHMEIIPEKELKTKQPNYYLPHHAVLRPTSITTKLRVVFDGSAAPEKGKSLNESLLVGPPLLQDIRDIITRWRRHKFCLVADVQKMYRQILVTKEDANFQRILWREDPKEPIQEYRLLTVTYGTSCAPFLAVRTLHQLADDERSDFPREAEILKSDVYMDDLMTGISKEEDAIVLQRRLSKLFNLGGFPLHKWSSNSESVLSQIPDSHKESDNAVNIKVEDTIKTLGITWNSQTDNFELKINIERNTNIITKRNVLSTIAKTFDPLGWLAPAIILLKIFMQKLWLAGLDWDEELTFDLKTEWLIHIKNFTHMQTIQFPRWLCISDTTNKVELHGFCDASCAAYACVVYLRVWDKNVVNVRLICAKSRVAPVKQVSIPRLELCGAVLLAKMLGSLKTVLNIADDFVFAWTDSTIVLAWLCKTPGTWTTFIANRTSEILTVTNNNQWHHIESAKNPADIASRGLYPADLQQSILWWNGPEFLSYPNEIVKRCTNIPETNIELKTKLSTHICVNENNFVDAYLSKFSSLLKLIRVTAYCFRFVKKCKMRSNTNRENYNSYLTVAEMKYSLNVCIRLSQVRDFSKEQELLAQGKQVHKGSKLYSLNPYLDSDNILRVGDRLANAAVSNYLKSPIILSNDSHLSKLIVTEAHIKTLHGGHQLTLNYIRQKYWIVRIKNLVKAVIKLCIPCFKQRAVPNVPFMGNLPDYRVQPDRPFRTSGVDFAGPFTLKLYPGRCKKTCKAYICLFICTVTKAIHLEVVSDLTSTAFLASFKRFTARRGHCKDIWSDCGTNFIGASRELHLTFKNLKSQVTVEIAELLANDQTNWHFIPPSSPHFGGLWESGVKSIKGHLRRVIGQTNLTFEEFSTLLTQVEACVNSRPLTLISSLPDELPLTPGHFLIGEAPIAVPEDNLTSVNVSPLQRWHMIQKMVQCLWQRWQLEYLTTLQNRYKWTKRIPDIQLDSVVLVKDDRLPPGKWLMGRVIAKHPGADGTTRVVTLQYKNNIFKRPVAKLCPLPLGDQV